MIIRPNPKPVNLIRAVRRLMSYMRWTLRPAKRSPAQYKMPDPWPPMCCYDNE